MGGGGESNAPACFISQTDGPILDPKMAFDSPSELSDSVVKFYLYVTDDVKGRVKGQLYLSSLA